MLELLNPEYRFSSLTKISPEWLKQHRYRVLLMDIDNTLLPRNSTVVPEQHLAWIQRLQRHGIALVIASNNGGKRISEIEKQLAENGLHVPVLKWAGKPFPRAYAGAIRLLEESFPSVSGGSAICPACILAVGDQIFTDVLGAHWYHLPVVLLRPLSGNDFAGTKVLRMLESWVKWYLLKRRLLPEEDKVETRQPREK